MTVVGGKNELAVNSPIHTAFSSRETCNGIQLTICLNVTDAEFGKPIIPVNFYLVWHKVSWVFKHNKPLKKVVNFKEIMQERNIPCISREWNPNPSEGTGIVKHKF